MANPWITNRTLVFATLAFRIVAFSALIAGMIWALVSRVISGEGYFGFVLAVLAILRETWFVALDEAPRVVTLPVRPDLPTKGDRVTP